MNCNTTHYRANSSSVPGDPTIRALWEDALLAEGSSPLRRLKARYSRHIETEVFRRARGVVAISEGLAAEVRARKGTAAEVYTIPNGVDTDTFYPTDPDESLLNRLGLRGRRVVAFIGSLYRFEGVETLIRATPSITKRVAETQILIVGSGSDEPRLRSLVLALGLERAVRFTGRVSHDEIQKYYSIAEVLVYPRESHRVTEMVTPLKPLEAMAMGKAVVASNVGGLKELLAGGTSGREFRAGNTDELADVLASLLQSDNDRRMLGNQALEYVRRERSWVNIVERYASVYDIAISTTRGAGAYSGNRRAS